MQNDLDQAIQKIAMLQKETNRKIRHIRSEGRKQSKQDRLIFTTILFFIPFFTYSAVSSDWIILAVTSLLFVCVLAAIYVICRDLYPLFPYGFCSNCGYDLTATPTKCPECGTVP